VDVALGVLLGIVLTASVMAVWRLARARRVLAPGEEGVRAALHAAATTLPHLRRGLSPESAGKTIGQLHALTQAVAVAIADRDTVLAFAGECAEHVPAGEPAPDSLKRFDRIHIEPRLRTREPQLPFGAAVIAPLVVQDEQIGWIAAFYGSDRRLRPEDTRVVSEVASLVAAQVELSALAEQEQRLAHAELRALRAQISPHFDAA
jgi:LytS/YehU family sensor histidine kinase